MNFEFKSTFYKYLKLSNGVGRLHQSAWIFLVNASSTSVIIGLYLSNRLIPATIVSRPHGMEYLALAGLAISVKILSTLYSGFITVTTQFRSRSPALRKSLTAIAVVARETMARLAQRYVYPIADRILTAQSKNNNNYHQQ
jgi:hypothetical protein